MIQEEKELLKHLRGRGLNRRERLEIFDKVIGGLIDVHRRSSASNSTRQILGPDGRRFASKKIVLTDL
jgi:hypothetical protein